MAVSNMGRRRASAIDVVCGMTKRKSERKLLYRHFPTSVTICGRFISICLNYTNISPFWT
ncbi:hypothetical protein F3R67_01230 [Salmonella enterica subsp. enterica]|nr:hypothetical protein [Salmonella enterica subsp. enterica]